MKMFPDPGINHRPKDFGQRFALYLGTTAERSSPLYALAILLGMLTIQYLHGEGVSVFTIGFWLYFGFSLWRNRQFMRIIRELDRTEPTASHGRGAAVASPGQ